MQCFSFTKTTSDDNTETSHPEVGYNGITSDSDISSLSDSPPNDCQVPSITNHIDGKVRKKRYPNLLSFLAMLFLCFVSIKAVNNCFTMP